MIWFIIISSLIAFLLWILLGPVTLFLNTDTSRYHLVLPGILKVVVVPSAEIFHIRGWIFFIPFRFNPFQGKRRRSKRKPEIPLGKWRLKKFPEGKQIISDAARSIRIRKLLLDIDTDDFMLNAWLVPVFSMVNSRDIQMRVNFEGTSSLLLDLRTRLGTLLWIPKPEPGPSYYGQGRSTWFILQGLQGMPGLPVPWDSMLEERYWTLLGYEKSRRI